MHTSLKTRLARWHSRLVVSRLSADRGDVPGWVMVTVMSAILVVAILGVFEPQIKSAISNALTSVSNSK